MEEFFAKNPVFTVREADTYRKKTAKKSARSTEAILAYHTKTGRIKRIKRGLYAVVPKRSRRNEFMPDPYLILAKMSADATAVLHSALEIHGKAYSVHQTYTFQTTTSTKVLEYNGWTFIPILPPARLVQHDQSLFGVVTKEISGMDISVSSLERCLVDCLLKPKFCGSWEEIWRSLGNIEFYDIDIVTEYLSLLQNRTLNAKVGFFLEQHKEFYLVDDGILKELKQQIPRSPHYFDRSLGGRLINEWNLIVPEIIISRTWEDVG